MRSWGHAGAGILLLLAAVPAQAEVVSKSDAGFVIRVAAEVTTPPAETWRKLVNPALWWSSQHTFSGDAANLTLDPVPGGCFCEKLPVSKDAPKGQPAGGVQHLRVVYVEPQRAIRLTGALGPLQSEALLGSLTMTVKPTEKGSRILWEYVVGGFMRYNVNDIAPAVDRMLSGQIAGLAEKLGPALAAAPVTELPVAPASSAASPLPATGSTYSLPVDETRAPPRDDVPVVSRLKPVSAKPVAKPLARPATPTKVPATLTKAPATPATKATTTAASKPAPKPVVKPAAKAAPKPAVPAIDSDHSDANAAFDAALGGTSP